MLAHHAGNMIIDDNHFIDMAEPLLGKHAHGGRTATNAHTRFLCAINNRRLASLHHHARAAIDAKFYRLAIAHGEKRFAGHRALALGTAGKMPHAAQG